jgi:hypothetical protein
MNNKGILLYHKLYYVIPPYVLFVSFDLLRKHLYILVPLDSDELTSNALNSI